MAYRPFQKDLTPLRKGGPVRKYVGKGSTEQRNAPGARETLTGGGPFDRLANRYPKPSVEDLAPPEEEPEPPVPTGSAPARMPTAMMPGGGADEDEE